MQQPFDADRLAGGRASARARSACRISAWPERRILDPTRSSTWMFVRIWTFE
jgi:hypothetical protein